MLLTATNSLNEHGRQGTDAGGEGITGWVAETRQPAVAPT
jgi:hypothetical protein